MLTCCQSSSDETRTRCLATAWALQSMQSNFWFGSFGLGFRVQVLCTRFSPSFFAFGSERGVVLLGKSALLSD